MLLSWLPSLLLALSLGLAGCPSDRPDPEAPAVRKQVAITIDDAPLMRFYSYPSQWHRAQVVDSLARTLRRHDAPATLFTVGATVQHPEGAELLRQWLDYGFDLGNHTMTHRSFNTLSAEEGADEIRRTNAVLTPFAQAFGKPLRFFRFPYLAEGATSAQRTRWEDVLREEGLRNAPVTISNKDWEFDADYAAAELAEDWEERYEIGQRYMTHIREAVAHWEAVADEVAGRPVRHVLLLHANRINRDYLPQILDELRAAGYEFISLDQAYEDPVYQAEAAWASEDGTSFLEHLKQTQLAAEGR